MARHRAKKLGIPFTITPADVKVPAKCPILKIPLVIGRGTKRVGEAASQDAASLDRIDPKRGYVPGNVQVVSMLANRMKQEATPAQLRAFANWVRRTQRK